MGVREMLGISESATERRAVAAEAQLEILQESLVDMQLAMEDKGWKDLLGGTEQDFTRDGLRRVCRVARVMALANPLIKRGLNIRQAYIWGGQVEIGARAGDDGDSSVNDLVQSYLDDPLNRDAFCGDEAQETLERALGTDGNVILAQFTNPMDGRVQTRTIPFDQIEDIFYNPEDQTEPWFYLRVYTVTALDKLGAFQTVQRKELYPALFFRPATRAHRLTVEGHGDVDVIWDAPIRHVKVNALLGQKWGLGDSYSSLSWARSYKEFLADWATLVKALSQFAWRLTTKGSKGKADQLRRQVQRGGAPQPGNPGSVGAVATMTDDVQLEAIPKTGATIDSESGKPLAAMVASGMGVPVTMLLSDPGSTGARAVAETLDKPTIEEMNQRRNVWRQVYKDILLYVILQSVKAPRGALRGRVTRDTVTGREILDMGATEITIDVTFPDLKEVDPEVLIKSIVLADGTGKVPPLVAVRLLLQALGVDDIDSILEEVTGPDGEWTDPLASAAAAAGQAAVDAYRRGEDPTATDGGDPDEEDPEEEEPVKR